LILSSNHEYVLEYISDYHTLQGKKSHADLFTPAKEINIQDIPLLSHQPTSCLQEENHVEEEHIDCETSPSVDIIDSQSINDVLKKRNYHSGSHLLKMPLVLENLLVLLFHPFIIICILISLMV
jgi:hypothetical protein